MTVALPPSVERRLRALEHGLRHARLPAVGGPGLLTDGSGAPMLPGGVIVPPFGLVPPGSPPANPTGLDLTAGAGAGDVWIDADWTPAPPGPAGPVVAWLIEVLLDGETLPLVFHPTTEQAPPFRISGLLADSLYHVTVRAITQLGASSTGLTGSRSTGHDTGPPPTLAGLAGAAWYTGAVVNWTPLGTVQFPFQGHYEAQTVTNAGFTTGVVTKNTGLASVASFAGLATGVQRWFRVRAVSSAGIAGAYSTAITLTPGTVDPGDLAAGVLAAGVVYAGDIFGEQITAGTIDFAVANGIHLNLATGTVGNLSVGRLDAGTIGAILIQLAAGGIIRSANYVAGNSGWQIDGAGNAELNNAVFRGIVAAMRLATNNLTIYDSSGEPALEMRVDIAAGSPKASLLLGAGIGLGAGLYWYHENYTWALYDPAVERAGMQFTGANVEFERTLWANGSIRVGGSPGNGGVYPDHIAGPIDTSLGFEMDSDPDTNRWYSYTKGWLTGDGDRRVGWRDTINRGWLAYANTNGDLNARGPWFYFSSRAIKRQIKAVKEGTVRDRLAQLVPSTYYFRDDQHRDHPRVGFIGEDVEPIFPELVQRNEADDLPAVSLDYMGLIPYLIQDANEQASLLADLAGRVAVLERST